MDNGFNFDLNIEPIDISFDISFLAENENRYHNPKPWRGPSDKTLRFEYAEHLAKAVSIDRDQRADIILSGNFVAGDFIEALFYAKNAHTKKLTISTLSLSRNNIDSLVNLIEGGFVDTLDLIVSDYFFAHERTDLMPYLLAELDKENRLGFAVAGSHTKIAQFETDGGRKIVIHGSANLRSSGCLEQMIVEENPSLYDFYLDFHSRILNEYGIIHQPLRNSTLWQTVAPEEAEKVQVRRQNRGGDRVRTFRLNSLPEKPHTNTDQQS